MSKPLSVSLIINKRQQKNAVESLGRFRIKREKLLAEVEIHENGLLAEMSPEERAMYEDDLAKLKTKLAEIPSDDMVIQKYMDRG